MKRKKSLAVLLALALALGSVPAAAETAQTGTGTTSSTAASTAVRKGLVKVNGRYRYYKNGKKITKKWKTINGKTYYFNYRGNAVTNSVKINGKRYIFNSKGHLLRPSTDKVVKVNSSIYYVSAGGNVVPGWKILKGKLYYVEPTGLVKRNVTWQGITFSDTGAAVPDAAASLKMKTMSIVSSITNSSMNMYQKLYACWAYVTSGRFGYYANYPNLSQPGWQRSLAYSFLTYGGGNCYGFACGFAALAAEVGFSPYLICGRVSGWTDGAADGLTRHCWVQIGGGYYDPEAQYAGWCPGIYGAGSYPMAHTIQQIVAF